MKSLTEIRHEKATYFVSINGVIEFEADTLTKCKNYLCEVLRITQGQGAIDEYETFIGMCNISMF